MGKFIFGAVIIVMILPVKLMLLDKKLIDLTTSHILVVVMTTVGILFFLSFFLDIWKEHRTEKRAHQEEK